MPLLGLGRLSADRAHRLLAEAGTAEPTYAPVGLLLEPGAAADADVHEERVVGRGADDFERAKTCFASLAPQRAVATVWPAEASAEPGGTVLVALPFGPLTVIAVNRVLDVVDEPRRWAFAYATLPGHAEVGEEAFVVEHRADDAVVASVIATAHVALPGARFLQPAFAWLPRRFARRYLRTVAEAVHP
ncbi:hypothetical protein BH10ACT1_BH10ACT1_00950 [soil metagenome]